MQSLAGSALLAHVLFCLISHLPQGPGDFFVFRLLGLMRTQLRKHLGSCRRTSIFLS
jgi:hypothetical protein